MLGTAPLPWQFAAVPALDQSAGHRDARRNADLTGRAAGCQFLAGEPAHIADLDTVGFRSVGVVGRGVIAQHELAREGPGLAAEIDQGPEFDGHVRLFGHLTQNGVLGRLPSFDETRERREPTWRPLFTAPQ